jgi:hypothetical protein
MSNPVPYANPDQIVVRTSFYPTHDAALAAANYLAELRAEHGIPDEHMDLIFSVCLTLFTYRLQSPLRRGPLGDHRIVVPRVSDELKDDALNLLADLLHAYGVDFEEAEEAEHACAMIFIRGQMLQTN